MIDLEELAIRSFDEPLAVDDQAALRVWADALEAAGDPRGALITMEYAIRAALDRRRELGRAMTEHAIAHGLLGGLGPLVASSRALDLDWRSGRLHGAFLDTRHVAKRTKRAPDKLVEILLAAPAAGSLRRLHVRVRNAKGVAPVLSVLVGSTRMRDLEELLVLVGVRPGTRYSGPQSHELRATFRHLRFLVIADAIVPLPPSGRVNAIASATPADPSDRMLLGRSLTSDDAALRDTAIARIAALGPRAFMFVDTLLALLEERLIGPKPAFARCLGRLGEPARIAIPRLATITGRPAHYDQDTRRAAGAAIASLT